MSALAPATAAKQAVVKKPEGFDLYSRFALAGALGCSITHGAFTPVDVYGSIIFGLANSHPPPIY
jgi:solute carrier family 25 phosphate transporter 3